MILISKLKTIATGVAGVLAGIFYLLMKRADNKAEVAEVKKEQFKSAVTKNIKELERMKEIDKIKNNVSHLSDDGVCDRLYDYARDNNSNKD